MARDAGLPVKKSNLPLNVCSEQIYIGNARKIRGLACDSPSACA